MKSSKFLCLTFVCSSIAFASAAVSNPLKRLNILPDAGDSLTPNERRIIYPSDTYNNCWLDSQQQNKGVCKSLSKCTSILNKLLKNKNFVPKTCYFQQYEQFVCCPEQSQSLSERKSEKACPSVIFQMRSSFNSLELSSFNPGLPKVAVVRGELTRLNEFPYMAALGWNVKNETNYLCGGVLISERFVLTAAHCAELDGQAPEIVRIGGNNIFDSLNGRNIKVKNIIIHPNYTFVNAYNDIALVELNESVSNITFACIWSQAETPHNNVTAMGYGHTKFAGNPSEDLLKAQLLLIKNKECEIFYPPNNLSRLYAEGIVSSQMCAHDPTNLRDTCQGDSGGPLIMQSPEKPDRRYVVGLTSGGAGGCAAGTPSVYTRISSYIDWIENIVWPN